MQAKKIYIKSIQNISFKAFALLSFVCVFLSQRIDFLSVRETEMKNAFDTFSVSSIGLGKLSKFYEYFGVSTPTVLDVCVYFSASLIIIGLMCLVMSFFKFRIMQVVNFITSFIGFGLSLTLAILLCVYSSGGSEDDIMSVSMNFVIWLPMVFFLIGSVFSYAFAKMPRYRIAEGRFLRTLGAALNPKKFLKTFTGNDDTEKIFRSRTPLKKRKYATISKPKSMRYIKNKEKLNMDLTSINTAIKKRDHAEMVANSKADEMNLSLHKPKKAKRKKAKKANVALSPKKENTSLSPLEIAKRKAQHAEMVASKKL